MLTEIRTICGKGRISYRPDWSPSKPYLVYCNGDAINGFATKLEAVKRLEKERMSFREEDIANLT